MRMHAYGDGWWCIYISDLSHYLAPPKICQLLLEVMTIEVYLRKETCGE